MKTVQDNDLRDFFAAFAMLGLVSRNGMLDEIGDISYELADKMMQARKGRNEGGIVAISRKKP